MSAATGILVAGYVDVCQSGDDQDALEHDRLHPVVHALLTEILGFVPPEPSRTLLDIVDVWTADYAHTARPPGIRPSR